MVGVEDNMTWRVGVEMDIGWTFKGDVSCSVA